MIIKGKYTDAEVFTDVIEEGAIAQIQSMCDSAVFQKEKIRIMPDVHSGAGCTIGTTMTVTDKVVPHMVGVDIGCGMLVVVLEDKEIDYSALDSYIRDHVPSGRMVRTRRHSRSYEIDLGELKCAHKIDLSRAYLSIGTLGGGNHFIEIDQDDEGRLYLVIHSGSRHAGVDVAEYYQSEGAKYHKYGKRSLSQFIEDMKASGKEKEIQSTLDRLAQEEQNSEDKFAHAYLEGELFQDYIHDMKIMQRYADLNRQAIADGILRGLNLTESSRFTTVHNYIDTDSMILRKGAVSASLGKQLLIPINMRDGSLICKGLGNPDWNCSAPHGAGRLMSRTKAQQTLSMEEFVTEMQGIYSTSVSLSTLDESPMAYKSEEDILKYIYPTVEVLKKIRPTYNFKSSK